MSIYEIIMLICFGVAWPISILKMLKTKKSSGKSEFFLVIIILGYIAGLLHKFNYNQDGVIFFYFINLFMVAIDLFLVRKYKNLEKIMVNKKI